MSPDSGPPDSLLPELELAFANLRRARAALAPQLVAREVGTITSVSTGIATVTGLPASASRNSSNSPVTCKVSPSTSTRTR